MAKPDVGENAPPTKGRPITSPTAPPEWRNGIRERMQAIGLTGKKLAELVGYAPVTVQVWLNGSVRLSVEKATLLEEGIDRYIADTQTTLALVQAGKMGSTTWATKPDEAPAQGKKGGK